MVEAGAALPIHTGPTRFRPGRTFWPRSGKPYDREEASGPVFWAHRLRRAVMWGQNPPCGFIGRPVPMRVKSSAVIGYLFPLSGRLLKPDTLRPVSVRPGLRVEKF